MGRKVPPQLGASVLRSVLQRRCIGSPAGSAPPLCGSLASTSGAVSPFETRPPFPTSAGLVLARVGGSSSFFPLPLACRTFCSNPASTDGSPDAIIIESEEDFNNSLKKVQEGALPAIFYFSAVWCGPCKFLAPVVNQLSKMYPPCVTYKIDIDMEGMQSKLSELGISAVPTLSFFNGGKKVATVVGADVKKIKDIMDEFFK